MAPNRAMRAGSYIRVGLRVTEDKEVNKLWGQAVGYISHKDTNVTKNDSRRNKAW